MPAGFSGGRYLLAWSAALILVVAGGIAGAVTASLYAPQARTVTVSAPRASQNAPVAAEHLAKVAAAVLPSVVTITVYTASGSGEGSGVILCSDGTIIPNNHVIESAAGDAGVIRVRFASGQVKNAAIIGRDPAADLAVIRAFGVSGASPARLATASGCTPATLCWPSTARSG